MNNRRERIAEERDFLGLTFFLIKRYHRVLVGLFLVVGVGVWIYYQSITPRKPKSTGAWSTDVIRPTVDIDGAPKADGPEVAAVTKNVDKKTVEKEPAKNLASFLATGTIEELIERALVLRDNWKRNDLPVAFLIVQERAKIAKRLMEMEISDDQRIFAHNEYIESIVTLDGLNCEGQMGATGIRKALMEVGELFGPNPDAVISAKANLAYVLAPAHDYFATKDPANLQIFANQFKLHDESIMKDPATTFRLTNLLSEMYRRSNFSGDFKECGKQVLSRLEASPNEDMIPIAKELREQIYFAKMELPTLVDRIEGGNLEARNLVQEFFESLVENPSCRVEIYQIAINVVAEYKRLGLKDDAAALANWLGQVNEGNTNPEDRKKIEAAVVTLKQQ